MPLNTSGTLSIGGSTVGQSINLELNRAATASSNLNETPLRTLAGVASGQISISNFYGKANDITSQYALFINTATSTTATFKVSFSSYTGLSSTNRNYSTSFPAAVGNTTQAIIGGGGTTISDFTVTTNKFVFSGNVVSAATNLNINRGNHTTFGNASVGIFCGGATFNGAALASATVTSRYVYSGDTCAASATLSFTNANYTRGAGAGNSTIGLYLLYTFTSRFTYSTSTMANGTSLTVTQNARGDGASATTAIVYLLAASTFQTYNLSTNAVTSAASSFDASQGGATGNNTVGLHGSSTVLNIITYSTNTITSTTKPYSFTTAYAVGNPPGGL